MSDYGNLYPPPQGQNPFSGGMGTFPTASQQDYAGNLGGLGAFGAGAGLTGPDMATATGSPGDDLAKKMGALQKSKLKGAQFQRQLAQAQALRDAGTAGNKMLTPHSGVNYAGALGDILMHYKAGQMDAAANKGLEGIGDQKADAAGAYFDAIKKNPGLSNMFGSAGSSGGGSIADYFS